MKILRVATVPYQIHVFLKDQILLSLRDGHQVFVVTGYDHALELFCKKNGVTYYPIKMARRISPWSDLKSFILLLRILAKHDIDIVHSISSKAGFLAALSGWLLRVPIRLHVFIGIPWSGMKGATRLVAKLCDWLILALNTRCYADGKSQTEFLESEGISAREQVVVLGEGSISGVDIGRFDRKRFEHQNLIIRKEINIEPQARVIAFFGRITREKGVSELALAFARVSKVYPDAVLLMIGEEDKDTDPVPDEPLSMLKNNPNVRFLGFNDEPEKFLSLAEFLVLPSYREGFCNAVIEAAALGLPAVGTKVMGLVDSIVEGETGVLVEVKTVEPLIEAICVLLSDPERCRSLGDAARKRVLRSFRKGDVNLKVVVEYSALAAQLQIR
jgi:glycosyltransferase involved in cell wall biosynthesis